MAAAGKLDLGDLESDDDAAFYDNNDLANKEPHGNRCQTDVAAQQHAVAHVSLNLRGAHPKILFLWKNVSGPISR